MRPRPDEVTAGLRRQVDASERPYQALTLSAGDAVLLLACIDALAEDASVAEAASDPAIREHLVSLEADREALKQQVATLEQDNDALIAQTALLRERSNLVANEWRKEVELVENRAETAEAEVTTLREALEAVLDHAERVMAVAEKPADGIMAVEWTANRLRAALSTIQTKEAI